MWTKHIVVIGASAGGIETLRELVGTLPADFPAPICVVLHTSPLSPGVLDAILTRAGHLPATNARDRETLRAGHIYVAPPDCHLLVEPGLVRATKGPRENRFRPAIDPLFRSAAQVYGPFAIGVILTGNLDDGTAGLWAIKQLGGTAIVQSPEDALFPSMPQSALDHVRVDHEVPVSRMGALLVELTSQSVDKPVVAVPEVVEVEVKIAKEQNPLAAGLEEIAEPSSFACPECHGVLLQLKEGGRIRFRCHTGHAYSMESLLAAISEGIEDALWNAIRALEEGELLLNSMAAHITTTHAKAADAEPLLARAAEAHRQSETIRQLVMEREPLAVKP
jgi:two-component system, chemotaxis family, protein-glutamate methylesterase/glutaminase